MEYQHRITIGGYKPKANDRVDMLNLLYVNEGDLYWTEEKNEYKKGLINAGLQEILFESSNVA